MLSNFVKPKLNHPGHNQLATGRQSGKLIVSRLERLPPFHFVHVPPRCPIVRGV